jgi:hypothetical protein
MQPICGRSFGDMGGPQSPADVWKYGAASPVAASPAELRRNARRETLRLRIIPFVVVRA